MESFSALQSPEDPRDFKAEEIFPSGLDIPNTYDPRKNLLPVRNQGSQGSCVAESTASVKEIHEKRNTGFEDYMSPQFVYNHRVNYPGEGMYPRDSMSIIYKRGILPEEDYPYGRIQLPADISQEQLEKASNYKVKGYAYIRDIYTLKAAILKTGGALITFPVFPTRPEFWRKSNEGAVASGGHAVSVVGWTTDGFIIRNSWGSEFGDNGYVIYPYSEWGAHGECWALIDDESSKPDERFTKWYWKVWRATKYVFRNFSMAPILSVAALWFPIASGFALKESIFSLGVLSFLAYKIYKDKLYLYKDKN